MSPECITGTFDEPSLSVPQLGPFFFFLHALKIVGIAVRARWSFRRNEVGSDPKGHFIFERSNCVDGKKASLLVYIVFHLVRLLPFIQGDKQQPNNHN